MQNLIYKVHLQVKTFKSKRGSKRIHLRLTRLENLKKCFFVFYLFHVCLTNRNCTVLMNPKKFLKTKRMNGRVYFKLVTT